MRRELPTPPSVVRLQDWCGGITLAMDGHAPHDSAGQAPKRVIVAVTVEEGHASGQFRTSRDLAIVLMLMLAGGPAKS